MPCTKGQPVASATALIFLSTLPALFILGCDNRVTIKNPDSLPALKQQQDFSADYAGRNTDVMQGTPPKSVPYDKLDADVAVGLPMVGGVKQKYWAFGFASLPNGDKNIVEPDPSNPDDPVRAFHGKPKGAGDSSDWDAIVNGREHCAPTTAAMVLTYWAKEKGKTKLLNGLAGGAAGQHQLISKLAEADDTNDQNPSKNSNDNHGHFATFGKDARSGISEFASSAGETLTSSVEAFDFDKYKASIKRDEPVILFFRNPGKKIGHVVVGYGYKGSKILFKDPSDGTEREGDSTSVVSSTNVAGAMARAYGQLAPPLPIQPSLASDRWTDVVQLTVEGISP